MSRFPALRALASRNYRLYVTGQGLSLIGTWMQQLAMGWLVYRLTGSSRLLGLVVFAAQIPMLVLSPIAGGFIDRLDQRRVVLVTQTLLLLQAAAFGVLTKSGAIRISHIFALSLFSGIVSSLDMPTRQAMVGRLVEPDVLPYAIPLMSSVVNVTRLLGPALAGLVIAWKGEAACFFLNALSFLAVIVAVHQIRLAPPRPQAPGAPGRAGFVDGLRYALGFPPIASILILFAFTSLVAMPYAVLMPVFARDVLRGGASTLGFLTASSGVGALTGSVYLVSRGSVRGLLRRVAASAALFGAGLVAFSSVRSFWTALPCLFVAGFGVMVMMAAGNTVLQNLADDDRRGRVMSLYVTSLMGMAPVGALLIGAVAARIGAPHAVRLGGALAVVAGALFGLRIPRLRPLVRPIYLRKGLVPSPAAVEATEIDGRAT